MKEWRVRKRNGLYEVVSPSGKVRCRLRDGKLAYEVATDMIRERLQDPPRVRCIETGKIYENHGAAAKKTGIAASSILRCCTGVFKSCGGFTWEFVDAD